MKSVKNKDSKLVSIVIPMYNHSNFVEQCLDSIICEGYPNIEVLIIDDGSTDNSYEVVSNWRQRNQNSLSHFKLCKQKNCGITKTFNSLLRMSNGDYICPLASDDYLLPGGINARIKFLENNPKLLAVFGDCLVVDKNGEIISKSGVSDFYNESARKKALLNHNLIGLEIAMRWTIPGPVLLIKREILNIIGYYDESLIIEDYDYFLRMVSKNVLGFIDYRVACYRWHEKNQAKDEKYENLRIRNLGKAAYKTAKSTKGMLKWILIIHYIRKKDISLKRQVGFRKINEFVKFIVLKISWKLIDIIQIVRIYLSKK